MPATPGSHLQKEYQREIRNQCYKIKVVEKTGSTLKEMLQKSDPFKRQRCGREDCLVCKQVGKGPCNEISVKFIAVFIAVIQRYTDIFNILTPKSCVQRIPKTENVKKLPMFIKFFYRFHERTI